MISYNTLSAYLKEVSRQFNSVAASLYGVAIVYFFTMYMGKPWNLAPYSLGFLIVLLFMPFLQGFMAYKGWLQR